MSKIKKINVGGTVYEAQDKDLTDRVKALEEASAGGVDEERIKAIEEEIEKIKKFYPIYQHRIEINSTYDLNGVNIVAKFLSSDKTPIDTLALCATNRKKILSNITEFGCCYSSDGMGNDEYTLDDILFDPVDELPRIDFYDDGIMLYAVTTETVTMDFTDGFTTVTDTITEV